MKVEGWRRSSIGEVITQCDYGLSCSLSVDPIGPAVLRMGNLADGRISLDDLKYVSRERVRPTDLLRSGDILLNRTNSADLVGKVALFLGDYEITFASYLFRLRSDTEKADPKWLTQVIGSPVYQQKLRDIATPGVSQANINREVLKVLPLDIPPLPEQRKIAAILSSVDDTIETTQAVIDQLQIVKKAMMQELLTRGIPGRHTRFKQTEIGEVPEEWEVRTLGALGHIVTGSTPSTSDASLWGGDYGFVTPGDMGDERVVSRTERTVTERGLQTARELPRNTIMVTCIGTIGKVGIAGSRCCSNQQINSIICFQNIVPEFVFYLLVAAKPQLLKNTSITAVPIINKGRFEQLLVPLPRPDEQREIGSALAHVDDVISANTKSISSLRELKSALLSVLLTGELRVKPQE